MAPSGWSRAASWRAISIAVICVKSFRWVDAGEGFAPPGEERASRSSGRGKPFPYRRGGRVEARPPPLGLCGLCKNNTPDRRVITDTPDCRARSGAPGRRALQQITGGAGARPGEPDWPGPAWPGRSESGCCSWCRPSFPRPRPRRGWCSRRPGCSRS